MRGRLSSPRPAARTTPTCPPAALPADPACGGEPRQVTSGPVFALSPSYAPDGRRIVFERTGGPQGGDPPALMAIDPDGSNLTQLTAGTAASVLARTSFSPDGQTIVIQLTD